jgi:hypothetical protein
MAEDKLPSKAPWLDEVKRTGQLTLGFDDSLRRTLWDRVFRMPSSSLTSCRTPTGSASPLSPQMSR